MARKVSVVFVSLCLSVSEEGPLVPPSSVRSSQAASAQPGAVAGLAEAVSSGAAGVAQEQHGEAGGAEAGGPGPSGAAYEPTQLSQQPSDTQCHSAAQRRRADEGPRPLEVS